MPIFDHFNLLAPFYDRVISSTISDELLRLLAPLEGSLILDAGGGTGRVSSVLTGVAARVVVADLSQQMLRQAAAKPGLLPVRSQVEVLPFASGTFDRILMVDALHHVLDQAATAVELWRVLAPGGRIVIEEPNIETLAVKLIALGEKLARMRSRILAEPKISILFDGLGGNVQARKEGHYVWVVVEKACA